MDNIAQALLEVETLDGSEIDDIIAGKDISPKTESTDKAEPAKTEKDEDDKDSEKVKLDKNINPSPETSS